MVTYKDAEREGPGSSGAQLQRDKKDRLALARPHLLPAL